MLPLTWFEKIFEFLLDNTSTRFYVRKNSRMKRLYINAPERERESNNTCFYNKLTLGRIAHNTQTHCIKPPHFPSHKNCKNYYRLVE